MVNTYIGSSGRYVCPFCNYEDTEKGMEEHLKYDCEQNGK